MLFKTTKHNAYIVVKILKNIILTPLRWQKVETPRQIFKNDGRVRVSILTGQLASGGVERVLLNIIEGLPKDNFEICIYVTDFNNNTWIDKFKNQVTVIDLAPLLNWENDIAKVKEFLEISLTRNKTDVVFITNSTAAYLSLPTVRRNYALLFRKIRVYDLLHTHGTPKEDDAFLKISQPVDRYINSRVVISDYLKNYFSTKYPVRADKVLVIHNGLPGAKVNIDRADTKLGAKILGLKTGQRAITFVGRLQHDKSPERLVVLARDIKSELEKARYHLAIIGSGEMENSLKALAREYGVLNSTIRFYGFSDNPLDIMAASTFTILTSNLEGLPMSVLESMSVGTPAIAPNVGGIPEIISDNIDGMLIDFTNDSAEKQKASNLAARVRSAIVLNDNDIKAMSSNAISKINNDFSTMEAKYTELFTKGFIK